MMYYDNIVISRGNDFAKSNNNKECMIVHSCFLNQGFNFRDYVRSDCHDLTILDVHISNIAIITVKNFDYSCIIHNSSQSEAINLLENSVFEDRGYL